MNSTQGIPIYLKIPQATKIWRRNNIFSGLHHPKDKKK
jgi:hypothetical protein